MDDTTRVHIIQGRSHLTASRCRQVQGFSWRFPPKFFPSNCWLFGQIFGRTSDQSQNFTDSKFPWRQNAKWHLTTYEKNRARARGAPARLLLEPTSVEAFDWNLRSLVSPRLNHHLPAAWVGSIPWVLWRDGLRMDMVWKIWPLMDIMYHKFYQFIHINSRFYIDGCSDFSLPACRHNILSFGNVLVFQDALLHAS